MGVLSDIGGELGLRWQALPQSAADGDIAVDPIDRLGVGSCVIAHACGAAVGAPDSYTIATKLQHSPTNVSDDFVDTGISVTTLDADNASARANVNLASLDQYIRIVTTMTFIGGTDPEVPVAVAVILGGSASGSIT